MFRRLLLERALDRLNPPPPRGPHPVEDQAMDRAVLLHRRSGWITAGGGTSSSDVSGAAQSHIGCRPKALSRP
eukprot:1634903-Pyramimonas_sp.AAC.1